MSDTSLSAAVDSYVSGARLNITFPRRVAIFAVDLSQGWARSCPIIIVCKVSCTRDSRATHHPGVLLRLPVHEIVFSSISVLTPKLIRLGQTSTPVGMPGEKKTERSLSFFSALEEALPLLQTIITR